MIRRSSNLLVGCCASGLCLGVASPAPGQDTGLTWCSYLGASETDTTIAVTVEDSGILNILAVTDSDDFEVTSGSPQGGFDVVVMRIDPALPPEQQVLWATRFGGSENEYPFDMVRDAEGNLYISGATKSSDFRTSSGAYDAVFNGVLDVFVTKLSPDGLPLWSTLLGGADYDWAAALDVDDQGRVTIGGFTYGSDFPTTDGAFDSSFNGGRDAFVSRLDPEAVGEDQLIWSTYLGGSANEGFPWEEPGVFDEFVFDLVVVDTGDVYLAASTNSANFPTAAAYNATINGGRDIFVSRLTEDGSSLQQLRYSTLIGGLVYEAFIDLVLIDGEIVATGFTRSRDYPLTSGAADPSHNGDFDAVVVRLRPEGMFGLDLRYSSVLGGCQAYSLGYGIAAVAGEADPVIVAVGQTEAMDFPVSAGALDQDYNGGDADGYIARLALIEHTCPADTNADGWVDVEDLVAVMLNWSGCAPGPDVNDDGVIDVVDLSELILTWGACP
jgi:hypothetical protein